jgi:hypothetical protein
MAFIDKVKKITKDGIDEIKNMPVAKKEKELHKKQDEKGKLLLEKDAINRRLVEIDEELEIAESYIKVLTEELRKMKK